MALEEITICCCWICQKWGLATMAPQTSACTEDEWPCVFMLENVHLMLEWMNKEQRCLAYSKAFKELYTWGLYNQWLCDSFYPFTHFAPKQTLDSTFYIQHAAYIIHSSQLTQANSRMEGRTVFLTFWVPWGSVCCWQMGKTPLPLKHSPKTV
jgi:hypothetical protein